MNESSACVKAKCKPFLAEKPCPEGTWQINEFAEQIFGLHSGKPF
jgi:hypothetical protein